jgi:hypothetical protein
VKRFVNLNEISGNSTAGWLDEDLKARTLEVVS